jgi:hypothetical protein
MGRLGHYAFDRNLKPFDVSGWLDGEAMPIDPEASFWMRYWIAAYTFALAQRTPNVPFCRFRSTAAGKKAYLEKIACACAWGTRTRRVEKAPFCALQRAGP